VVVNSATGSVQPRSAAFRPDVRRTSGALRRSDRPAYDAAGLTTNGPV